MTQAAWARVVLSVVSVLTTYGCNRPAAQTPAAAPPRPMAAVQPAAKGVAPDLGRIVFVRGGDIWIANADGSRQKKIHDGADNYLPTWSPDSKLIAFMAILDTGLVQTQVFVMNADGSRARGLTEKVVGGGDSPRFTPDGKSVLMVAYDKLKQGPDGQVLGELSIAALPVAGGQVRKHVKLPYGSIDFGPTLSSPVMSPDGERIAYHEGGTDVSGFLKVVDLNGKLVARFPKQQRDNLTYLEPSFSPDGKKLLCFRPALTEEERNKIVLIEIASGKAQEVAEGDSPRFALGGKGIIFVRRRPGEGVEDSAKVYLQRFGEEPVMIIDNGDSPDWVDVRPP